MCFITKESCELMMLTFYILTDLPMKLILYLKYFVLYTTVASYFKVVWSNSTYHMQYLGSLGACTWRLLLRLRSHLICSAILCTEPNFNSCYTYIYTSQIVCNLVKCRKSLALRSHPAFCRWEYVLQTMESWTGLREQG